jgi:hypothetical protein
MHKLLRKPSPAMIVACLALFAASTGTSIAARHYLITSTKQIKPSVIKKLHGAKGAKGAKGAAGAAGVAGAAGAKGAAGATHVVTRGASGAVSYYYSYATASCATGEVATGGGVTWAYSGTVFPVVLVSAPVSNSAGVPYEWTAEIYNEDGYSYSSVVRADVYVICASP